MSTAASTAIPVLARLAPLARVHPVRVAAHSQLRTLVAFALDHLQQPHARPLLLHTLPPSASPTAAHLDAGVAALPKLVSVAQLITRNSPRPLHQYTRLAACEQLGWTPASPEPPDATPAHFEQMRQDLVALEWLTARAGKQRRPRRKHTPCMVILLSPEPLDSLPSSFTYQAPTAPRPDKGAKKRPASSIPVPDPGSSSSAAVVDAGDVEGGDAGTGVAEQGDDAGRRKRRRRRRQRGNKEGDAVGDSAPSIGLVASGGAMDVDAAGER